MFSALYAATFIAVHCFYKIINIQTEQVFDSTVHSKIENAFKKS